MAMKINCVRCTKCGASRRVKLPLCMAMKNQWN